jgi:hypothetical protein
VDPAPRKGGKRHTVSARHLAETYLEAAKLDDPKAPLCQSVDRKRRLTGVALPRREVLAMTKRRAAAAGLPSSHLLSHVSGDRHHDVSDKRRHARTRAADCC